MTILLALLLSILAVLPLHAFLSTWGGTAIGPLELWKVSKELLLLAAVPVVGLYCWRYPASLGLLWGRLVNRLVALYVVLNVIFAIVSQASMDAVLAGLIMNLRFIGVFLLAQLLIAAHPQLQTKLQKWLTPALLIVTIFLSIVAILQVTVLPKEFLMQFGYNRETTIAPYILVDQNPDALRAFATLRGPNTLGSYLLLPLALALALIITNRRNVFAGVALGLGAVALVLTGSRSAWLGAVCMLIMLGVLALPGSRLLGWVKRAALPSLLLLVLLGWAAVSVPSVRLAIFHSSPDDPYLIEGSTEQHWLATARGIESAMTHPLGQGVGTAGPASFYNTSAPPSIPENYFVQIAQEVGLAGLALFIAINALLVWQVWQQRAAMWPRILLASLVGLSLINLLQHGWADDATAMTWWALAGLFAWPPPKRKAQS